MCARIVLGAGDAGREKTDVVPALMKVSFQWSRHTNAFEICQADSMVVSQKVKRKITM